MPADVVLLVDSCLKVSCILEHVCYNWRYRHWQISGAA